MDRVRDDGPKLPNANRNRNKVDFHMPPLVQPKVIRQTASLVTVCRVRLLWRRTLQHSFSQLPLDKAIRLDKKDARHGNRSGRQQETESNVVHSIVQDESSIYQDATDHDEDAILRDGFVICLARFDGQATQC